MPLKAAGYALLCVSALLHAQVEEPTRVAEILVEREAKAKSLQPDDITPTERRLVLFKQKKVLERFTAGIGGVRAKLGGLATNGGFAFGPEYYRGDLADGSVRFRSAAQVSLRGFQKYDIELGLARLAGGRAAVDLYAVHHNYSSLQYYGPGPDSEKTGRSAYRLEDTAFDGNLSFRLFPRMSAIGSVGYVMNNVGPGQDNRFISADRIYSPAQAPGIDQQTDFLRYGGALQFDYRDTPFATRRGGNYFIQASKFLDRKLNLYDFWKVDAEAQQYLPFFNERRVIALRARTTFTGNESGRPLPFYMQPNLGGSETLRGYRAFRFHDNNLLLMSAEYRYEVFSGLDMALFADAGKVTRRKEDISFSNLESSVGFGLRFNVRNNVFLRIDCGFSHEGFQVWLKFNKNFTAGPYRTSSSQGDY